jgi:tyrosine-specific transport protein
VKKAIIGGATLTLVIYLIWEFVAIGILPLQGQDGLIESYKKAADAAQAINSYVHSPTLGTASQALALFAILTSFLAQTLSLVHFLADGIKKSHHRNVSLCLLALLPSLLCAVAYPQIFYGALNFAGGVCTVILFGLIPALMIYQGRFKQNLSRSKGWLSLVWVVLFAMFILFNQIMNMLGFNLFPHP